MDDGPRDHGRAILHLTDLHFGTERERAVRALRRLVQRLRPAALVVTGDLTQRATAAQLGAAAEFVDGLAVRRRLVLPGNHDLPLWAFWERLAAPRARWRRRFGSWLPQEPLQLPGWHIVAADTVRVARHRRGAVTEAECRRVAALLAQGRPGAVRAVAMHHPLAVRDPSRVADLVLNREAAARTWARAGASLVLAGHVHDAFVRPLPVDAPPGRRTIWAVQGGTALSTRLHGTRTQTVQALLREPASRAVVVRRWRFSDADDAFVDDGADRLPLGAEVAGKLPVRRRASDMSDSDRGLAPTAVSEGER